MKVGVLGSGGVAKALTIGFLKHGHDVLMGTRTPSKLVEWAAQFVGSRIAVGEVLVLAVKGNAAAEALRLAGAENLQCKPVLDACNPIEEAPPENGVLKFFTGTNESLMEQLQREFPEAKLVKAFNSVGSALMVNPQFKAGRPTMFICGNDDGAKLVTAKILDEFGWETADMGSAEAARAIEPLCMLWCLPGFLHNEWTHAFKLLRE
jgi:hypothetical protein